MCQLCAINPEVAEAFAGKLIQTFNHGALSTMISLGYRAELFDAMDDIGPCTIEMLVEKGYNARYVEEWLATMVTGEVIAYDSIDRTYTLPKEHAAFLTRSAGIDNLGVLFQFVPVWTNVEDELLHCLRHGGGIPYERNERFHRVMADDSGKNFRSGLMDGLLPLAEGLIEKLESGINVLDVGSGAGSATIEMAKRFPNSTFVGLDLCEWPVNQGNNDVKNLGLNNISFIQQDATQLKSKSEFDLITTFDAIHDQAHPDIVLKNIHRALKEDGIYLMMDINASSRLEENLDHPVGTAFYTMSLTHCMTVSLAQGGMGLGAMWGKEKAQEMLKEAGFSEVDTKTLEDDFVNVFFICQKGGHKAIEFDVGDR